MAGSTLRGPLLCAGAFCLLAGCQRGPVETPVPPGLTYQCDAGGTLAIRFNGGGYQPDARVRAVANGAPSAIAVHRSTAELDYDGKRLLMIPEHSEGGLRYRSEARHDGRHFLVWTQRGEAVDRPERWARPGTPGGPEDVRLGQRVVLEPSGEEEAEGEPIALCRRDGRAAAAPAHAQAMGDPLRR